MYDHERLIQTARSQVGYREGATGGHWNNDQRYSDEVPGFAWSDGQPWCDTFVAWCFWSAGLAGILLPAGGSASVWASYRAWCDAGRFTEYPTLGAQLILGRNQHTGICVGWDDTHVFSVEGNTNDDGAAEGNGVYAKTRRRRDDYVTGYGIPAWPDGVCLSADPAWHRPPTAPATLPPAAAPDGAHVWLAHLLAAINIDSPGPDGAAGANTGNTFPVEQALAAEGLLAQRYVDGSAGTMSFGAGSAYQRWQYRLGYRGQDADGIPGIDSLTELGRRHGFVAVNDVA